MVIADDGLWLDSGGDEELSQGGLELSLSGLEIVTDNEDLVLLGELDDSWNKGVLGRSIDVGATLRDGGKSENGGWGDFWVILFNGLHDVFVGIMDSSLDLTESLSVGSPEDNNLIDLVGELEISDILSDLVQVSHLVVSWENVISSVRLVGSNEIWVIDRGEWNNFLKVGLKLFLEVIVKNLSTSHRLKEVQSGDIPSVDDDIIRVNKREDVVKWEIDLLVSVNSDLSSRSLGNRTIEVWGLFSLLGIPGNIVLISK